MLKKLKTIALTALWVVPLQLCLAIAAAKGLAMIQPHLTTWLGAGINWPITLGYGVLMLLALGAAIYRRSPSLSLALAGCLAMWLISVVISTDDPNYWGHTPKLYLVLWAWCLSVRSHWLAWVNFAVACVAYAMVRQLGASFPPSPDAMLWIYAHNALYWLSAAVGAVAALTPELPPHDAEKDQQPRPGKHTKIPEEIKKAA